MRFNRIGNAGNPYQGDYKRVLCVCSAGLLRSPTTAVVLSQKPYNYNTRAAGINEDFALVIVDEVLLSWAQEIVCMQPNQKEQLEAKLAKLGLSKPVICLDIEDSFAYRNEKLIKLIKKKYNAALSLAETDEDEKAEQKSS